MTDLIRELRELADAIRNNNFLPTVRAKMAELTDKMGDFLNNVEIRVSQVETSNANTVSGESSRVTAENARKTSETNRVNAESSRVTAENTRVSNENTRKTSETTRVNAESSRVTAENTRVSNENTRKTSETTRVNAESTRVSNENSRKSAETDRVNAENARKSSETNRVSAENARISTENVRVSQENVRVANENNRVDSFTSMTNEYGNIIEATKANNNENLFINPQFDVWSRFSNGSCTLTATNTSQYFADRWNIRGYLSGTVYFTRERDEKGSYLRMISNATSGNNNWLNVDQSLYIGQRLLQGRTVTISYTAIPESDITGVCTAWDSHLTEATALAKKQVVLKANVENKVVVTFENLRYQTQADTHCRFTILGLGNFVKSMGNIRIRDVKLEFGAVATPFVPNSYLKERNLCDQAYLIYGDSAVGGVEQVAYYNFGVINIDVLLPNRMYNLGVKRSFPVINTFDVRDRIGNNIVSKNNLDTTKNRFNGRMFRAEFKNADTNRQPQYCHIDGLHIEAEIYSDTL